MSTLQKPLRDWLSQRSPREKQEILEAIVREKFPTGPVIIMEGDRPVDMIGHNISDLPEAERETMKRRLSPDSPTVSLDEFISRHGRPKN